ncbi:hypothetical protein ABBQ38_011987 [Trebouxia sp. C0009 RCD-2024]
MNSPSRKGPHEFMPSRWSSEASAALDELKKTTKALQEISSNVKCLVLPAAPLPSAQGEGTQTSQNTKSPVAQRTFSAQQNTHARLTASEIAWFASMSGLGWCLLQEAGVAEDEVKYGAAARLAKLDADLLDQQQEMALCLQARRAALDQELQQAQTQLATSEGAMKRKADEVGQLDCQSRHLQEALAALHEEEDHSLQKQRRMVATAEEEVHVAEKQCSQARGAVQQVEQARLVSTELQAQLLRADQALHSQRQFVMSLQAAAQEAAQGRSDVQSMENQQQLLRQLRQQEQAAQEQVKRLENTKAASQKSLLQAQQEFGRAQARLASSQTALAETGTEAATLRMTLSHKQGVLQAAKQQHSDKWQQAEMQRLVLGSLTLHQAPAGNAVPKHQMLHECFSFKQPQSTELAPLVEALNLIAGDKLGNVLVDTAAAAADVLAWHSKTRGVGHSSSRGALRVWDLQRLHSYDKLQQQKQAQAHFPAGHVILPLDLFKYQPAHHAAMVRAFGGLVIAKDDATAAQLVSQFGVACITPDGKISRPGSMQGGWRGHMRADSGPMARKLAADQLQEAVDALQAQLQQAETDCSVAQSRLEHREAQEADLAAAQEDLSSAQEEAEHHVCEDAAQQKSYRQCVESLSTLQARMHQTEQLLNTYSGAQGDRAAKTNGLEQQLKSARLKLGELTQQQEALAAKVETASDDVIMAAEQAEDVDVDALERCLLAKQGALRLAAAKLQELQAQAALQASAASDKTHQLAAITQLRTGAATALQELQRGLRAAQSTIGEVESQRQPVDKDLKCVLKQVPELSCMLARCQLQDTAQARHTDAQSHAKRFRQMQTNCRKLQAERKANKAHEVPAQEQMQFEGRKADLAMFKERAEALHRAVAILEEGIAASRAQVVQADEAVFDAVQAKFSMLTANLLPKLELKIERVAQEVHEGLRFAHRPSAAASKGQGQWLPDLSRLSGGERTLVSLALILAAATAGAKSSLFLMDEVDAALDENNQALVATLIKEIMTQDGGCQVLCVTHNLAFQQICSSIIQVTKNQDGATVLQDPSAR